MSKKKKKDSFILISFFLIYLGVPILSIIRKGYDAAIPDVLSWLFFVPIPLFVLLYLFKVLFWDTAERVLNGV